MGEEEEEEEDEEEVEQKVGRGRRDKEVEEMLIHTGMQYSTRPKATHN